MTSSAVPSMGSLTADWIVRLAADERKRDDVRVRAAEAAAHRTDLVAVQGQRLLDELRSTIARDIEMFRNEFPGDRAREILLEPVLPGGGFVVRKPADPMATLRVVPNLPGASVTCEYRFTLTNGLPPREDRLEFVFSTDGADDTLRLKHQGTRQVFTSADALSEYLLLPVFTGRPR